MYRRILVPTDGSPLSRKAADSAVQLAAKLGAELVAFSVVPHYPTSYFEGGISRSEDEVARIEQQWAEKGLAAAEEVVTMARAAGVQARAATVHSDLVAEAILSAAHKHECDLVVMASHGHRGLKRLLLGSETQHVLTHGTIPVLVLR